MATQALPRVAVVGGGFTGVCFAAHLLRAVSRPLQLDIVEPRESLGAGLAYGSAAPEHRINVPSDRMDVYREDPLHFTRWLQASGEWQADAPGRTPWGHHYARRDSFGRYMAAVLEEALAGAPAGTRLRHLRGRAVAVLDEGRCLRLTLALPPDLPGAGSDGELRCAALGLFTGHAPPAFPWPVWDGGRGTDGASAGEGWLVDPWNPAALRGIARDARVVIAGTGLTMADVVVSLRSQGHAGPIVAVSRRALLPRRQSDRFDLLPFLDEAPPPATARGVVALLRHRIRQAESRGLDWRAALDGLRRVLPAVWRGLPVAEQRRALQRLRPFWDVHRFRMAPQVADLLDAGLDAGWLQLQRGRVVEIERRGSGCSVAVEHRGRRRRLRAEVFLNCTGPDARFGEGDAPLLHSLRAQGLLTPDAHRLGPAVDARGRALDARGQGDPRLRLAGPMIKGTLAEVVGVPEASASARVAAEDLAAWLERPSAAQGAAQPTLQMDPP